MARKPACDQSGLKKGTWTPEEDRKLVAYVTRYGCWNWRQLPKFAGLARCGKSCRLRWMNYLRPDIKRGNYTQQEEETIIRLHQKLGNRWSMIAAHLPGRTDNEIKNHWHTNLKKHFQVQVHQKSDTHGKAEVFKPKGIQTQFESTQETSSATTAITDPLLCASVGSNSQISDTFSMSSADTGASSSNENLVVQDYGDLDLDLDLAFMDAYIEPTTENFWTEPYMVDISYVPNEALLPLSTELPEYFGPVPVCEAQLWGHNNNNNLCDEYIGLF